MLLLEIGMVSRRNIVREICQRPSVVLVVVDVEDPHFAFVVASPCGIDITANVLLPLLIAKTEFFIGPGLDLRDLPPNINAAGIVLKTQSQIYALSGISIFEVGFAPRNDIVPLSLVGIPKQNPRSEENP